MLNIDKNVWEETEVKEFGDYESLELGGHVIVIRKADKYTGQSGNESLRVQVDIDKSDKQGGFFNNNLTTIQEVIRFGVQTQQSIIH